MFTQFGSLARVVWPMQACAEKDGIHQMQWFQAIASWFVAPASERIANCKFHAVAAHNPGCCHFRPHGLLKPPEGMKILSLQEAMAKLKVASQKGAMESSVKKPFKKKSKRMSRHWIHFIVNNCSVDLFTLNPRAVPNTQPLVHDQLKLFQIPVHMQKHHMQTRPMVRSTTTSSPRKCVQKGALKSKSKETSRPLVMFTLRARWKETRASWD